ncbi:ATP-binding protein [Streptomyces sp. CA-111067]|uniref:ATP-binding protein n=1 Tax=Streptomyces sp. CA-111067 TaxID=3240046 RepID=UPI003D95C27B
MLYGRGAEQDRIRGLLLRAREGVSGALVVHGDAGIGKTALLGYAAEVAAPACVLRTVGIETEMELAFGGLHGLLRPLADHVDRLPEPQAAALKAAFGLSGAGVRDRLALGVAVLTSLSQAAAGSSLLCLVDDCQWLDQASLDALTFAARRLHGEGIVMLFGRRDGVPGGQIAGLPCLRLQGIDSAAADAFLTDHVADLSPHARDQVVEQAQGNPLALRELPAALSAGQRAGRLNPVTLPAGPASPTSRIQESFQERLRRLPEATRSMLLVAAADDSGDLDLVLRASARFGATLDDLEPAERATLILLADGTLSFRHPLIRSVTYQDTPHARRLAAHRALADALGDTMGGVRQADRRAWHLAAAATGTDEAVADAMVGVAQRAGGRQGTASASAAYERAAQLTAVPARRARLLASAAFTSAEAGQFSRTAALTDRINALALDPALLADFARVRAIVELDRGTPRRATRILLECADRLGSSADLAPVLAEAALAAQSACDPALMSEVAARIPVPSEHSITGAMADPAGTGYPAGRTPAEGAGFAERILAGTYDRLTADHPAALKAAAACVRDCRDHDVVGWLHTALHLLAEAQMSLGLHEEARSTAMEGLAVAEQFGRDHRAAYLRGTLAALAALRGEQERCTSLSEAALRHADAHGIELAAAHARRALGLLGLGLGRPEDALGHLEAARARVRHPALSAFLLPDLVEAAIRAGRPDRAEEPALSLARWAQGAGRRAAVALARRCQAMTGPGDEAEQHFTAALHLHDDEGSAQPFERARTELLYGEWLRRERRRTDARHHLRAALETFETAGAQPWAARARGELQASGGAAGSASDPNDLFHRLSPQEREVVRLAATGATNREIAEQLFLSPRTVGHHLYRAFPKLNINSRTELPHLFPHTD